MLSASKTSGGVNHASGVIKAFTVRRMVTECSEAGEGMRPFEGIKVLDLTHVLAGPFAAYQLAVLGADVIKIERPDDPDQVRVQGPDRSLNAAAMGSMFLAQGCNKRSLTLNLKQPRAREILLQLVATADVLIENYRPGAFDALGLGYDALSRINPKLIYCSISAYGSTGPRGGQTGYDNVIQACSGLMEMTGTSQSGPLKVGAPVIDYGTGAMCAFAISSALFQRTRTGRGQRIDLSMLDASLMLMASHVSNFSLSKTAPKRIGNAYPFASLGCFDTKDGALMLGATNMRQYRRLWTLLGQPERILPDMDTRIDHYKEERAALETIFLTRTAQEWEDWLQQHHIPAARVRDLAETLEDPQIASRPLLATIKDSEGVGRPYDVAVAPFSFAHGGPGIERPAPRMGEHNAEILEGLGLSPAEIEALHREDVI